MNRELLNLDYYDFYQGVLTLVIFILGLTLCSLFTRKKSDIKYVMLLYTWHSLFAFVYYYYSLTTAADAKSYYTWSLTNEILTLSPGTSFVIYLTSFFSKILSINYLNTTLTYSNLGALGMVFLYLSLKKTFLVINRYWMFILFLPSMSFWSAGLGKDSISFMAVCLFLYGVTTSNNKKILISFGFLAMFMVRPHIAFIMLVSFIVFFIVNSKVNVLIKALMLPIIISGSIIALQFTQQYVGLGDVSLNSLDSYVGQRQGYNLEGGSSLDIASMSYPMQMFTYIFRPLPFEAHSIVSLITSIENTILLLLFTYIFLKSKFNFRPFIQDTNLWLLIYVFFTCSILALTTANLGIATRQKWMFMPVLIYLLIYALHSCKVKKSKVYQ